MDLDVLRMTQDVIMGKLELGQDVGRETVERPVGTIKQWVNQGAFLMRGLAKVRGEFSLTALAYNLRQVLTSPPLQSRWPRSEVRSRSP
jgi:Transposase DDE domain